MLVATLDGDRMEAEIAERGLGYVCPICEQPVVLKRGRIKIAHFAHKPPTNCTWTKGETQAHLEAKKLFQAAFVSREVRAEVEFIVRSLPNDRRADVMVWSPSGMQAAIELQHSNIGIKEIEKRSFSYAREGIAQAWLPFLRPKFMTKAVRRQGGDDGDLFIEKYPARPFERWAHALHFGRLWFYDPKQMALWRGHFDPHKIWVEESSWYSPEGDELFAGNYSKVSKQWKDLTLWGPHSIEQVRITFQDSDPRGTDCYNVPAGRIVKFVTVDASES